MSSNQNKTAESKEYKWTNRAEYQNDGLQELGDQLTTKQSDDQQQESASKLLEKVLHKSDFALLYFNDETKEMSLYNQSSNKLRLYFGSQSIGAYKQFSQVKNYFVYNYMVEKLFGGQGLRFTGRATRNVNNIQYGIEYRKTLWERLDNYFSSNKDEVALLCNWPKLKIRLSRENRDNYVDFIDKNQQKEKVFGDKAEEINVLKQSNLISLNLDYKYSFVNLKSKLGWDYCNQSYFFSPGMHLSTTLNLTHKYKLFLGLTGGSIIGNNILKNDLLFRNAHDWPGNRSKNFISPRLEFIFNEYPFVTYLSLKPYIYAQLWGSFRKNENNRIATKVELDYGIGIISGENARFDLSLLKMSGEKEGRLPFGQIKFSF